LKDLSELAFRRIRGGNSSQDEQAVGAELIGACADEAPAHESRLLRTT
jgi:hypothetical protein